MYKYILGGIMLYDILDIARYAFPALTFLILLLCFSALLKRRAVSLGNASLVNLANGDSFPLKSRETSIGRYKNCDVVLNYSTVSRQHAVVVCSKDGWYITGVKADSDVKVNGQKIEKKEFLKSGDKITLGSITLVFENEKAEQ